MQRAGIDEDNGEVLVWVDGDARALVLDLTRILAADSGRDDRGLTDEVLDEEHVAASITSPPACTPSLTERLLDGDYTQGASGDLVATTVQAVTMVTVDGMGGTLSSLSAERYQAGGSSGAVDRAVEALLGDALSDARVLLERFRGELEQLRQQARARPAV